MNSRIPFFKSIFLVLKVRNLSSSQLVSMMLVLLFFGACQSDLVVDLDVPVNNTPDLKIENPSINFAVIGDFGDEGENTFAVSEMVKSMNPDFVLTVGDNNYDSGDLSTIQENIAQYYCDFVYNPGAPVQYQCNGIAFEDKQNRFFPSLGNHDQDGSQGTGPYEIFFSLPGNEIFYDFEWGPVHFFALNSGNDTDHDCCDSEQAIWLKKQLELSTLPFKVVYFHHPPFSSGRHGNNEEMEWPFEEWGVDAVLAGHDHNYERINEIAKPDIVYFVNGLGGKNIRDCDLNPLPENQFDSFCYNGNYGAMYCSATEYELRFQFFEIDNTIEPVDEYVIRKGK